jgi:hypothetical protein
MFSSTDIPESALQELQQVYFVLEYFAKLEKIQHDKTYASLQTKYASLLSSAAKIKTYPTIKKIGKNGLLQNYDTKFNKDNIVYHISILS